MAVVQDELPRFTGDGGVFGELEHGGPLRMVGSLAAFLRWQRAVGVYFLLEPLEERFSCRELAPRTPDTFW
jgi:hypothetical protein